TAGLAFSTGDGSDDPVLVFTGTLGAINTALDGLVFAPTAEFSGGASLEIATDDLGNTGSGGALMDTDNIAITVNAVNDAPVITSGGGGATANIAWAENGTAVGTVTSSDVDGGVPLYSIVGGADAARFAIDGATGALTFLAA